MNRPPVRFSLAILMAFIGVIAVGLGGMRVASWTVFQVAYTLTVVALLAGLLGAIVRRGDGAWVGFTLFGGSYALLAFGLGIESETARRLVTSDLLEVAAEEMHADPAPPAVPTFNTKFELQAADIRRHQIRRYPTLEGLLSPAELKTLQDYIDRYESYEQSRQSASEGRANAKLVGHSLLALLFALAGAVLGRALERPRHPAPDSSLPGA